MKYPVFEVSNLGPIKKVAVNPLSVSHIGDAGGGTYLYLNDGQKGYLAVAEPIESVIHRLEEATAGPARPV